MMRQVQHQGIRQLFDVYESDQYVHLVLESINEAPLFEVISRRRNYTEADVTKIMRSLFQIIGKMHENYIIHRDIKPANIVST